MELDEVKKIIQDFFQENTVTVIGSGLSLAEGIPGMSALATELLAKLPALLSHSDDIDIWSKIAKDLSFGTGLEQALQNTRPTLIIEESIWNHKRRNIICFILAEKYSIILIIECNSSKKCLFNEDVYQ